MNAPNKLLDFIKKNKMSNAAFARELSSLVSPGKVWTHYIWRWVTGTSIPTMQYRIAIEKVTCGKIKLSDWEQT